MNEFTRNGLATLDAFHLAWAEHLGADVLVTTDSGLQSKSRQLQGTIKVRVTDPVTFVAELSE
jgi:predicted nucleic acid-binding protein